MTSDFASFADFLAMGGHGFYVWLAYGVAAVIVMLLLLEPSWRRRQLRQRLQAYYRREQLDAQERRDQPEQQSLRNERSKS